MGINSCLPVAQSTLKKPGAEDMPLLMRERLENCMAKLSGWKASCSELLHSAKKTTKDGKLPKLDFLLSEVSTAVKECKDSSATLLKMLVLAKGAA
jgi:hypothetical protein